MWFFIFFGVFFVTSPIITTLAETQTSCSDKTYFKCHNGTDCDVINRVYSNNRSNFGISAPRIRRQSSCGSDQWECRDGGCISLDHLCDGVNNCNDRSDETDPFCRKLTSSRPGRCILPPYPISGTYEVSKLPNARPGQAVDSFVLRIICRKGFGVVDPEGGDGSPTQQLFCVNGDYQYQSVPKCVRFCKLNPDPSVRYMCHVPGIGFKTCSNYVAPGTLVKPVCNRPIYTQLHYSTNGVSYMICNSGYWNDIARCSVDCGRVTPESVPLIIDGKEAKRGELPWHAGIYRKSGSSYAQICGGSIISNNVVISAAHCFWSLNRIQPASSFAVAVGKIYRDWYSDRDLVAQKSDVKQIKIPDLFLGSEANYQEDIAILILHTPFIYKTYIRPVCLYYDSDFEKFQLQKGNSGKVAGWGLNSTNGNASETLQVLEMPFVPTDHCIRGLPQTFREYITGDKFCAGHTSGKALCKGDSGGGLAFPDRGLGIHRYYLRGIVSTAPKDEQDNTCNDHAFTAFTRITKHQDLIDEAVASSTPKKCPHYAFQCDDNSCVDPGSDCNGKKECADGSDETDALCKPGSKPEPALLSRPEPNLGSDGLQTTNIVSYSSETTANSNCILPEYPNHGTYESTVPNVRPGLAVVSVSLTVRCQSGYMLDLDGDASNSTEIQCYNGEWQNTMPECNRYCRLEPDPSVKYSCKTPNTTVFKECKDYVIAGTIVEVACNSPNYYSQKHLPNMRCIFGSWDYVARCLQDCGRIIQRVSAQNEINRLLPPYGEVPWHVGIHRKYPTPYTHICGGSIVSNKIVVSAASCFWNNGILPASHFAVAARKLYRDWSDNRDGKDAQKSDVEEIKISSRFKGSLQDIAILILVTPFVYTGFVQPVCLDFDYNFDKRQLQDGAIGKIAGWGSPTLDENYSNNLQIVELPYVNKDTCIATTRIAPDQFCTGSMNGQSLLCAGFDGGGLVFPVLGLDAKRYYLRGVVSKSLDSEQKCQGTYNVFTSIMENEHILFNSINDVIYSNTEV